MKSAAPTANRRRRAAAFTLAEVLAALAFMAIVIPVAIEALHLASVSGQVAVQQAEAARIADRVLNESLVTTNWTQSANGTVSDNGREFSWTLRSEPWPADSLMELVTAEVTFTVGGTPHSVQLSTLAVSTSTLNSLTGIQ
ncbi:MAG: hypothetical protein U1F98_03050 [Verrucomicrobiota bacterium]